LKSPALATHASSRGVVLIEVELSRGDGGLFRLQFAGRGIIGKGRRRFRWICPGCTTREGEGHEEPQETATTYSLYSLRIGNANGLLAPPPRERPPPAATSPAALPARPAWRGNPASVPSARRRAAQHGLDTRHSMGEGRAAGVATGGRLWDRRLWKAEGGDGKARLRTDLLDNRSLAMLLEISKRLIY